MPEIFRFYGFSFFFYSREHEPVHIHVEENGGFAKNINMLHGLSHISMTIVDIKRFMAKLK